MGPRRAMGGKARPVPPHSMPRLVPRSVPRSVPAQPAITAAVRRHSTDRSRPFHLGPDLAGFSAVCWYFGQTLDAALNHNPSAAVATTGAATTGVGSGSNSEIDGSSSSSGSVVVPIGLIASFVGGSAPPAISSPPRHHRAYPGTPNQLISLSFSNSLCSALPSSPLLTSPLFTWPRINALRLGVFASAGELTLSSGG